MDQTDPAYQAFYLLFQDDSSDIITHVGQVLLVEFGKIQSRPNEIEIPKQKCCECD